MFKSTREFDAAVYSVLKSLIESGSLGESLPGIEKADFDDVCEHIIKTGFVKGLSCSRTMGDSLVIERKADPRITRTGLTFVERIERTEED